MFVIYARSMSELYTGIRAWDYSYYQPVGSPEPQMW